METTVVKRDAGAACDAELVAAVRKGDHAALEVLFRRHHAACLGLARRVVVNAQLAEEVVQEAFLRLWNDPDRFDAERGTLRTYLNSIVHSAAIDVVRSERARRCREERDGRRHVPAARNVDDDVVRRRESEAVRRALSALSDDERAAITLAYFGGHTYREVARLLAQPEGTVKSRIRSGLHRLERELRSECVAA